MGGLAYCIRKENRLLVCKINRGDLGSRISVSCTGSVRLTNLLPDTFHLSNLCLYKKHSLCMTSKHLACRNYDEDSRAEFEV